MQLTNKIKTLSAVSAVVATLFLAGCQAQSNTLTFTPPVPTASMSINQSAVAYVMTKDSRIRQEVASYTKNGELIKLNASPAVPQLFQQVMQQNLLAKGFRVGQFNHANVRVTVDIRDFFTQVDSGNLHYKLNAKIQAVVYVQGAKGNYNKTFNATRLQEGVFTPNNKDIQKVLEQTFNDVVNNIYQDQEIVTAINQYTY